MAVDDAAAWEHDMRELDKWLREQADPERPDIIYRRLRARLEEQRDMLADFEVLRDAFPELDFSDAQSTLLIHQYIEKKLTRRESEMRDNRAIFVGAMSLKESGRSIEAAHLSIEESKRIKLRELMPFDSA